MKAQILVGAAAVLVLAACGGNRIDGSGVSGQETRSVDSFTKVELAGVGEVHVSPGTPSVAISGDDNIVPRVTTKVVDGTLVIGMRGNNVSPKLPLLIDVRGPKLVGSSLTGAGTMAVTGVEGDAFAAKLDGAGTLDVDGHATSVDATLNGVGTAALEHLVARDAHVVLNGTGTAKVYATGSLDASVPGAGSVVYGGNPGVVTKSVSGVGSVAAG